MWIRAGPQTPQNLNRGWDRTIRLVSPSSCRVQEKFDPKFPETVYKYAKAYFPESDILKLHLAILCGVFRNYEKGRFAMSQLLLRSLAPDVQYHAAVCGW